MKSRSKIQLHLSTVALIDGSEIDVSAMGAHSGGKKEGNPESQDNNSVKHSKKKSG